MNNIIRKAIARITDSIRRYRDEHGTTSLVVECVFALAITGVLSPFLISAVVDIIDHSDQPQRPASSATTGTWTIGTWSIEPSTCTADAEEGITAAILAPDQDGTTVCQVAFDTSIHRQVTGVGGWCESISLASSPKEGSVIFELKSSARVTGSNGFTFFFSGNTSKAPYVSIEGVIPDASGAANGTVPCPGTPS